MLQNLCIIPLSHASHRHPFGSLSPSEGKTTEEENTAMGESTARVFTVHCPSREVVILMSADQLVDLSCLNRCEPPLGMGWGKDDAKKT